MLVTPHVKKVRTTYERTYKAGQYGLLEQEEDSISLDRVLA